MASSSSVQQFQQPFQCKQCGVTFNSAESLDVHLQYHHKENWSSQASSSGEETNNNMTKGVNIKREFTSNSTIAAADSSELQKKSPDYNRHTPEGIFGQPPTPQSYQSASSPYQNPESSTFSPGFQNFSIKTEGQSSAQPHFQSNSFSTYSDQQYYTIETQSQYNSNQEGNSNKAPNPHNSFRYHPYLNQSSQSGFDRVKTQAPVPPSSPAYPPQPTPSPSPKHCDKCGYVCESAAQLIEHNTLSHPSTPQVSTQYSHNQHFMFDQQQPQVKTEENASQSEILDLDSQKVVHNEWEAKEAEKRPSGDHIQHSVSGILSSWPPQQSQANMFHNEHINFINETSNQKVFQNIPESKVFSQNEQKIFQSHQNFINNGVTSTNQELGNNPSPNQPNYRPFENLPSQPPVISSSTSISVPNNPSRPSSGPPTTKSNSWKSNEARRPKTYNCTACNKWFTSSGHLKRHYNTTLHKNAVKSSGHPDPATLPISAHHHPARDSANSKDNSHTSNSPISDEPRNDDSMGAFERLNPMPGMLQHPPNGPYDRQGPPIQSMHSPMAPSPLDSHSPVMMNPNFPQMSNGSPPNGEAGLSPNNNLDSRGLLAIGSPNSMAHPTPHGFSPMMAPHQNTMIHPMDVTTSQYQMYPNEYAPHVTQATDTNNHSTIGEFQFNSINTIVVQENQPLPSFEQIQVHRFGLGHGLASVGGQESVTASFYYPSNSFEEEEDDKSLIYQEGNEFKFVTTNDHLTDENNLYSPLSNNNNNDESSLLSIKSEVDIKFDAEEFKLEIPDPLEQKTKTDYEETTNSPVVTSTVKSVDESKTKCFDCDKVFNRPCYLTQHNKTCHMGDKPFKCTRCGKRFSSEEIYKEHTKKHAGEKPHKCEICPKQFNHKTDLRRHMCCHTGRKPYTCETCGKGFIRKDHMIKHTETHLRKNNKISAIKG